VATPIVKVVESWYNIHVKIGIAGEVVEFIFKQSEDEFFTDEGHPGLMVGRDWKSHEVIGYMTYDLPALYERILEGLRRNSIPGRFTIVAVSKAGHLVSIADKRMTDLGFAEVVKWTYRAYFADETVSTSAAVGPEAPIKEKALADRQEGYVAGEASQDASSVG
jgi:hypothetical protein